VCSQCGNVENIFGKGGGKDLAKEVGVRFLGDIPLDPEIVRSGDEGYAFLSVQKESPTAQSIQKIIKPILMLDDGAAPSHKLHPVLPPHKGTIKVALPVAKGTLAPSMHLAEQYVIATADAETKKIVSTETVDAPKHEAKATASFLERLDTGYVLAKDVPQDTCDALKEKHISLVKGITVNAPIAVVTDFIEGKLLAAG
jgi:ATP-binding protein involved in chromosome partitioning